MFRDLGRMQDRIVDQALADARQRAIDDEAASRLHQVTTEAVEAYRACRERWSETQDGPLHDCGLPSGHAGRHVLIEDQEGPLVWAGAL